MTTGCFRLDVLKRICDIIAEIDTSDDTDNPDIVLQGAVFRGRAKFGSNDPDTMISILEDPREVQQSDASNGSAIAAPWRLLVQGFCDDDPENPTDPIYHLSELVRRHLKQHPKVRAHNDILGFGARNPCVTGIKIGRPIVRPPDEISEKAYFWLPLTLEIIEPE